ncbi:MAG: Gfo/Idh/MocA family oxidoreductase [Erysipelotrichaceae bacterium]|nr:Gfo/Idh/MocA family oxidoreductase [Erysipelotrichaceae bacterium]
MINVGIIGAGGIVPFFIETTKMVKGFKYVGIAARNEEKLKAVKEKYGISYYSTDNDEVLSDPKIDVIYVAVPNSLHYEIGKKALENGKHVIMEKPFCANYAHSKKLIDLANEKGLIIFDAVTMLHMPNYAKIKDLIKEVGDLKMVDINFSQYSSRYDKFKKGIILPALDRKMAGGALMDLGIYNINFTLGLFGMPKKVEYYANKKKGIDTSGVLIMDYGNFKVNAVCAKDCKAPLLVCIQGDKGFIRSSDASSVLKKVELVDNAGKVKEYALNKYPDVPHYDEYVMFKKLFSQKDLETARKFNELTLMTMKVLDKALKSAQIDFK